MPDPQARDQRIGPNMRKLMLHKMSLDAVPPGSGVASVVAYLSDPKKIGASARAAEAWAREAVAVVKTAPDNPYGDDDESIAAEILRKIEERKRGTK